jgi:hypothetical protein
VRLGAAAPVSAPARRPPARAADANAAGAPAAPPQTASPESGAEDEDRIAALLLSSEGDQGSDAPAPGGAVPSDSAVPGPEGRPLPAKGGGHPGLRGRAARPSPPAGTPPRPPNPSCSATGQGHAPERPHRCATARARARRGRSA